MARLLRRQRSREIHSSTSGDASGTCRPARKSPRIELQRVRGPPLGESRLEQGDIAPQTGVIDAQLLATATQDRVGPELLPQQVDGLAQDLAPPRLVRLGPEEREEGIAPYESLGLGEGDVDEKGEPLGLSQDLGGAGGVPGR